jgi:hypothetical protein
VAQAVPPANGRLKPAPPFAQGGALYYLLPISFFFARRADFVLLGIRFFARRDEFLSSRLVEAGDAGTVHGEDGSDGESAV